MKAETEADGGEPVRNRSYFSFQQPADGGEGARRFAKQQQRSQTPALPSLRSLEMQDSFNLALTRQKKGTIPLRVEEVKKALNPWEYIETPAPAATPSKDSKKATSGLRRAALRQSSYTPAPRPESPSYLLLTHSSIPREAPDSHPSHGYSQGNTQDKSQKEKPQKLGLDQIPAMPLEMYTNVNWIEDSQTLLRLKDMAKEWGNSCQFEVEQFRSVSVIGELMLNQVMKSTHTMGTPNPIRTAVACYLLYQSLPDFGRGKDLILMLFKEVLSSIYCGFDFLDTQDLESKVDISALLSMETFFEVHFVTKRKFEVALKQSARLKGNVDNTTRLIGKVLSVLNKIRIRFAFTAWHVYVIRVKSRMKALTKYTDRLMRRDMIQTFLYAWRLYAQVRKNLRDSRMLKENMDYLAQKTLVRDEMMTDYEEKMGELREKMFRSREKAETALQETSNYSAIIGQQDARLAQWKQFTVKVMNFFSRLNTSFKKPLADKRFMALHGFTDKGFMAESTLIKWFNDMIANVKPEKLAPVTDFSASLEDGVNYTYLLKAISGKEPFDLTHLTHSRFTIAEVVITRAATILGRPPPLTVQDLVKGVADLNFLFVYSIWIQFSTPTDVDVLGTVDRIGGEYASGDAETTTARFDPLYQQLQDDFRVCGNDISSWLEVRQIVSDYAMSLMMGRIKGPPVELKTGALMSSERMLFVETDAERLREMILDGEDIDVDVQVSDVSIATENNNIGQVLSRFQEPMRKLFKFYAGLEGDASLSENRMDFNDYIRMCLDTKVVPSKEIAVECYRLACKNKDTDGVDIEDLTDAKYAISPQEWTEAIVRLAWSRYIAKGKGSTSLASAVENFLGRDLLSRAAVVDASEFRSQIWQDAVQSVLKMHRVKINKFFKMFAKGPKVSGKATMDSVQFCDAWKEAGFVDWTGLSQVNLIEIFEVFKDSRDLLQYSDFEEAIVGASAYRYPSPFTPLYQKIRTFLEKDLFPAMVNRLKISIKGVSTK